MDSEHWQTLVEKVILRTQSRQLRWVETDEGPDNTLSFGTSIDETTTLNMWGYTTNYSYELVLKQETSGDPFEERIRVTSKKTAQGIDFKSLFDAIQTEMKAIIRDEAFDAVMEYLADPTIDEEDKSDELQDKWLAADYRVVFTYEQDEQILEAVRGLSRAGTITWIKDREDGGSVYFAAEIGRLLDVRLDPLEKSGRSSGGRSYIFEIADSPIGNFSEKVELSADPRWKYRSLWTIADELHALVTEATDGDKKKFNDIVRNDIIHGIFSTLDDLKD